MVNPGLVPADYDLRDSIDDVDAMVLQDLLATANQAQARGDVDHGAYPDSIRNVRELVDVILKENEYLPIAITTDWRYRVQVSKQHHCIQITDLYRSHGLDFQKVPMYNDSRPEAFVLDHGRNWWGWVHPRWRWVYDLGE